MELKYMGSITYNTKYEEILHSRFDNNQYIFQQSYYIIDADIINNVKLDEIDDVIVIIYDNEVDSILYEHDIGITTIPSLFDPECQMYFCPSSDYIQPVNDLSNISDSVLNDWAVTISGYYMEYTHDTFYSNYSNHIVSSNPPTLRPNTIYDINLRLDIINIIKQYDIGILVDNMKYVISNCYMPFITGLLQPGHTRLCTEDSSKIQEQYHYDDVSYWNSEMMKSIRYSLLVNEVHDKCKSCIERGVSLVRKTSIIDTYNAPISEYKQPQNLFIMPSNKCNLACKICNTDSSTTYNKIMSKYGINKTTYYEVSLSNVDLNVIRGTAPYIKSVIVTGGDSFYDQERTLEILDILDDYKHNIWIIMCVNGQTYRESILEKLKGFYKCTINISLDGAEDECRSQRILSDRTRIVKNVLRIHQEYNMINLQCHMAISNITMLSLVKFSNELVDDFQNIFSAITYSLVESPNIYATWNILNVNEAIKTLTDNVTKIDSRLSPDLSDSLIKAHHSIIHRLNEMSNVNVTDINARFMELENILSEYK